MRANRKPVKILLLTLLGWLGGAAGLRAQSANVSSETPVILIIIDTLRPDHLGLYGYKRDTSPHLDAFAAESLVFEDAVAQSSWTAPGVTSILTGLYPKNHGVGTLKQILTADRPYLPELLKEHGYLTYGVATNFFIGAHRGYDRGYDRYEVLKEDRKKKGIYARSDEVNEAVDQMLPELLEKKKPFFLYIHYMDPHAPYRPGEVHFSEENQYVGKQVGSLGLVQGDAFTEDVSESERPRVLKELINAYDDEIRFNDRMIGKLFDRLKETGIYDRALILVMADHGEAFWEHGRMGHKHTLYEEEIRIPLLIRLPGGRHKKIEKQVSEVDIVPSVLGLLGVPVPDSVDGTDFLNGGDGAAWSFAELDSEQEETWGSVRGRHKKMILKRNLVGGEQFSSHWQGHFLGKTFEGIIYTDRHEGDVQVLLNGKPLKVFRVGPKEERIKVEIDRFMGGRIEIQALNPCQDRIGLPIHGAKKKKCINFRFRDESPKMLRNPAGEGRAAKAPLLPPPAEEEHPERQTFQEYYRLDMDPGEEINEAGEERYQSDVEELTAVYESYERKPKTFPLAEEVTEMDPQHRELLRSLGYLQ